MSSSFSSFPSSFTNESDPIGSEKAMWYSTSPNPAKYDEGLYDYCQFCLENFKQFHNMVNNVCQSCGRVARPVMRDEQDRMRVTSVNTPQDPASMKAVSLEIDYSPLDSDPTSLSTTTDTRMTAQTAGEAIRKVNTADALLSRYAQSAALTGQKFLVKTNLKDREKKVMFDSNL